MLLSRKVSWVLLLLCAAVALVVLAYPLYVIRPFRAQGSTELQVALAVKAWAPFVAIAAAAIAIVLAASMWRSGVRMRSRVAASFTALLAVGSACLTHVNIYELMFHRIDSPQVAPASTAGLDPDDMVLAVKSGGHSRAYPIRMMGYHHIVNDRIDQLAIVATY